MFPPALASVNGASHHFDCCMSSSMLYSHSGVHFFLPTISYSSASLAWRKYEDVPPMRWQSDQLMWFVSEQQRNTVYLFTKEWTHYLYVRLLFMWTIMLMTWRAKDTDYFNVFTTISLCGILILKFTVVSMAATIFDGSGCSLLHWDLLCCIGN